MRRVTRERTRACLAQWSEAASRRAFPGSPGFTLLEVLLGLALMALVAALVLPRPNRPVGPAALRTAAYEVSAALRNARTTAISDGRPATAVIDHRAGRVEGAGGRVDMPPGITVALLHGRQPGIRFAPDGSSTGGAVVLASATAQLTVAVNAETGAVQLAP
jgi:general secretion pathway protein H